MSDRPKNAVFPDRIQGTVISIDRETGTALLDGGAPTKLKVFFADFPDGAPEPGDEVDFYLIPRETNTEPLTEDPNKRFRVSEVRYRNR